MRWSRQDAAAFAAAAMHVEGIDRENYDWDFVPDFQIERLRPMEVCRGEIPYGGEHHWRAWLDAEAAYWEDEGHPRDYVQIAKRWFADPSRAPVVAILGKNGTACIIDGTHHTALAKVAGHLTVPVILGSPMRTTNPTEFYFDVPPTEPMDVPWADEFLDQIHPPLEDPQIRLLLDTDAIRILERLATAPRRDKWWERVPREAIEPVEYSGADDGWFLDTISGRHVVLEDHPAVTRGSAPYWKRETEFPDGAITLGELTRLEALLWRALEKAADLYEDGMLTASQRDAAVELARAADRLSLRMRVLQMHPDPEMEEKLKKTALDVLAYGCPRPREVNRKTFSERPHDWDEVLVSTPSVKLTRGDLRDIYRQNAEKIVDAMRGHDAIVLIGIGNNRTILRRKGPDGKPIRITKATGIDDPHSLQYWAERRLVELHRVIGAKTNVVWVDLDPKGDGDMRSVVLDIVPRIKNIMRSVYPKAAVVAWDSGKRGVHVEGYLPSKVSTDAARRKLRKALQEAFAGNPRFTTGIAKPGQVRLDVTTLKRTGSLRSPWTPTAEGRLKRPI